MAFAGTPDINFTSKAGRTLSGTDLTAWVDQISSEDLNVTTNNPQVSSGEQLNSVDVVDFPSGAYIETAGTSTYERLVGGDNETNIYIVMKSPLNAFGYITDAVSALNRNAIRGSSDANEGVSLKNGGDESPWISIPPNEWGVLRAVHAARNNTFSKIFWNDDLLWEDTTHILGSSSGTGMVFGSRQGGSDSNFAMTVAQIVEYADQSPLSEADHEQNLAEFESEWGLDLLSPEWNPYLINGDPQAGIVVEYTAYDDRDKTNPNLLERVVTDAQGNAPLSVSVPAGKHLAAHATYVDSGTGDTYADIERWIEDYPE